MIKTPAQLNQFFAEHFADAEFSVSETGADFAQLVLPVERQHLRPGNTVSGPTLMALADAAAYAVILAAGGGAASVTSQLQIHFLRRPAPTRQLVARARRQHIRGMRHLIAVDLFADSLNSRPVAVATVDYVVVD